MVTSTINRFTPLANIEIDYEKKKKGRRAGRYKRLAAHP